MSSQRMGIKRVLMLTLAVALAFPVAMPLQSSVVHADEATTAPKFVQQWQATAFSSESVSSQHVGYSGLANSGISINNGAHSNNQILGRTSFVFQPLTSDATITARITGYDPSSQYAGVMVTNENEPNTTNPANNGSANMVLMALSRDGYKNEANFNPNDSVLAFARRDVAGDHPNKGYATGETDPSQTYWVKLDYTVNVDGSADVQGAYRIDGNPDWTTHPDWVYSFSKSQVDGGLYGGIFASPSGKLVTFDHAMVEMDTITTEAYVGVNVALNVKAAHPDEEVNYSFTLDKDGIAEHGAAIDDQGVLNWTPTAGGTYDLIVTATAAGQSVEQKYSIFVEQADKSLLEALVLSVEEFDVNDYTADSWNEFEIALIAAQDILSQTNPTQPVIDAALEALTRAVNYLVGSNQVLAEKDTYLHSGNAGEKNGSKDFMTILNWLSNHVGNNTQHQRFGMVTFNLSDYSNRSIESAELVLYKRPGGNGNHDLNISLVNFSDWPETAVDYHAFSQEFSLSSTPLELRESSLKDFLDDLPHATALFEQTAEFPYMQGIWRADITDLIAQNHDEDHRLTLLITANVGAEVSVATRENSAGNYAPIITLEAGEPVVILDKEELQQLIDTANARTVQTDRYTAESIMLLSSAISAAQTALEESTTQDELDDAVALLQEAIKALVLLVPTTNNYIDKLVFGNEASEQAHNFVGAFTEAIIGGLGETARISMPRQPQTLKGGDLVFTMKVDPTAQNYLTVKFWGEDATNYKSIVYINGEQLGSRRGGDFEPLHSGTENYRAGTGHPIELAKTLNDRFFYRTTMLPIESTYGQDSVEITIRTYHPSFSSHVTSPSRGYYNAYTHTQAYLDVSDEQQGFKFHPDQADHLLAEDDRNEADKQALIDGYTDSQRALFNSLSNKSKLSIIRYQDELKFFSSCLTYDWCPADTNELKEIALQHIFDTIDSHVKDYYANTRMVQRGGHQGDWGGFYGALGEALYTIENLIMDNEIYGQERFDAFLDEPFETGTVDGPYSLAGVDWDGGQLTRRGAWERTLKANFDFARSRLSYIFNQVMYTYEGAWKAHEGLRIINSEFFEGDERSRQILLEALGAIPFLGEEVLVGPDGEELDLYHSLFYHDGTAQFTADTEQIVAKGLAQSKLDGDGNVVRRLPFGKHYTVITEAGLTRENGYVGNYGESANYLPEYYYKTLNNGRDPILTDEILKLALKNIHARGYTRYTDLADDGKRVMRMEQVIDDRNPTYSGNYGYATRITSGKALHFASLEHAMIQNQERYSGEEWDIYWQYAKEAVGYVQQQIADNQFFNYFSNVLGQNKYDHEVAKTYQYITADRANYFDSVMAGVVHPQTDFNYYTDAEVEALKVNPADYEQFAWVDIDAFFVSLRDGDTRIFGQLNMLNRGFAGNGRLHVINKDHDKIVQIATNGKFQYEDYTVRMDDIDIYMIDDQNTNDGDRPQALAGEINPITFQPGVGTVVRENWEPDHAYSAMPDLLTARYGEYFMIFNSTRDVHENSQTFQVELPADFTDNTVFDLVSGEDVTVVDGHIAIGPKSAMVLKLTSKIELDPKPFSVDYVGALAGNGYAGVNWKTTAGAVSYTLMRSTEEDSGYTVIASNLKGNYYKDEEVSNGNVYYYKVVANNEHGQGWPSYRAKLDLTHPVSVASIDQPWRDDRLGGTSGTATINGNDITIIDVNGSGLGIGNDYKAEERNIIDTLHFVNQVVSGSASIEAEIVSHHGEVSGIMMRDLLVSNARYIYFGADEHGNLVLQNRTKDSRHSFDDVMMSPINAQLIGFTAEDYPFVKLTRDYDSRIVHAYVSADGEEWFMVHKMFTPFPHAFFAGVVASDVAQFSHVTIEELASGTIYPMVIRENNNISLSWNKPKAALTFGLYRTYDAAASLHDPVFKFGTTELADDSPWQALISNDIALSYIDTEPAFDETPYYKVVPIFVDGSIGSFSDAVYPAPEVAPLLEEQIKITNNPLGIADTIEVSRLSDDSIIKVYRTLTDTELLGSAEAIEGLATVRIPQLGEESGMVYVSIYEPNKFESVRIGKVYAGEDGVISQKVEKDATLRFNAVAPATSAEMTILTRNPYHVENDARYGIVTFNGVPSFTDPNIKSVTLRLYRANARNAELQAHLLPWHDWVEATGNLNLGEVLKEEYFNGSSAAIASFIDGPLASANLQAITGLENHSINAVWNIDVKEIIKANEGSKATFLLSVPKGKTHNVDDEANPVTKEYIAGQSELGQFATTLIIEYKVDKTALINLISTVNALEAADYTVETWMSLQATLIIAQEAVDEDDITQVEVNTKITNLLAAIEGLVESEDSEEPTEPSPTPPTVPVTPPAPPEMPENKVVADDGMIDTDHSEVMITLPEHSEEIPEVIAEVPASILQSLAESGKALIIQTGDVVLTIPATVIADAAASSPSNLSIHITLTSDVRIPGGDAVSNVYDLTITTERDGQTSMISTFNEPLSVQLPVAGSAVQDPRKVAGYRINGDTLEYVGGKYEDGKLTYRTNSLSMYVAIEKDITFADIATHWAKDEIEVLASRTITNGKGLDHFAPEDQLTRAEFAVLIARALNLPTKAHEGIFQDVTTKLDWAYAEIEAAYHAGMINGRNATTFDPSANITREELATMVMRAIEYVDTTLLADLIPQPAFNDASGISNFAREAAIYAQALGIIQGKTGHLFDPKGSATRAEAVTMLYRALEKLNEL